MVLTSVPKYLLSKSSPSPMFSNIFATRSPFRPNPLGLSSVELLGIEKLPGKGTVLRVAGADLMDGSPIYDIKPYLAYTDAHPDAAGGFTDATSWEDLEVVFPEAFAALFAADELSALQQALALDPRPRYHDDPDKEYGLTFSGRNIKFRVADGVLTVKAVD